MSLVFSAWHVGSTHRYLCYSYVYFPCLVSTQPCNFFIFFVNDFSKLILFVTFPFLYSLLLDLENTVH